MIVDDLTGNIAHIPDSVTLNIESSDSSSNEHLDDDIGHIKDGDENDEDDEDDEEDDIGDGDDDGDDPDDGKFSLNFPKFNSRTKQNSHLLTNKFRQFSSSDEDDLQPDNWEAQMLVAELNRRESKRDDTISSATTSDTSGLRHRLHNRGDTLDTDTENSELEVDRIQRPRAASFDQIGQRQRTRCVSKTLSFDRDKDRL